MSELTVVCEGAAGWTAFCMHCIGPLGGCLWLTDDDTTKINASRAARGHELGQHRPREPRKNQPSDRARSDMAAFIRTGGSYGLSPEQIHALWQAAHSPIRKAAS